MSAAAEPIPDRAPDGHTTMTSFHPPSSSSPAGGARRHFLQRAGTGLLGSAALLALAACGKEAATPAASTPAAPANTGTAQAQPPKITIAIIGGFLASRRR